jgi:hypothetical protein
MGRQTGRLRLAVSALSALPLAVLATLALGHALGPDPVGTVIRRTGDVALALLVLSLVPGAVRRLTGSVLLMPVRRVLGLCAFGYAALHLLSHIILGYGGQLGLLLAGLAQNRFALLGLATFLLMAPLAITSTAGWQRRLGRCCWTPGTLSGRPKRCALRRFSWLHSPWRWCWCGSPRWHICSGETSGRRADALGSCSHTQGYCEEGSDVNRGL